jgi:hypothetical protein
MDIRDLFATACFFIITLNWDETECTWYCGHYWPIVPAPDDDDDDDDDDCGATGGMKIGKGNRRPRRKPAPVPLCPPQIPHDLTRAQTRGHGLFLVLLDV